MELTTFFCFIFLPPHFQWPVRCDEKSDWTDIITETCLWSSSSGIKWLWCDHLSVSYLKKVYTYQKCIPSDQTYWTKKKSDWANILQKHTYRQSPGTGKTWFCYGQFSLSYFSTITQKNAFCQTKRNEEKVWLDWYFKETYLWTVYRDSLKWFRCGNFSMSYLIKLLKNAFHCTKHGEERADWDDILQKHNYEQSSGMAQKWFM